MAHPSAPGETLRICARFVANSVLGVILSGAICASSGCGDPDANEFAVAREAEKQAALHPPPPPPAGEIDLAGVLALRPPTTGPALVDARGAEAWRAGHIPGALSSALDRAALQSAIGNPKRLVIIYGEGPGDGQVAEVEARIHDAGYPTTKRFPGGMQAWNSVHARTEIAP
jgi:rhodanese-related sulfurtransferase